MLDLIATIPLSDLMDTVAEFPGLAEDIGVVIALLSDPAPSGLLADPEAMGK